MSLYKKIESPVEDRKSILLAKINALNALKKAEEHNDVRKGIKKEIQALHHVMIEMPEMVAGIMKSLPHDPTQKIPTGKGYACEVCGRGFKSATGLKQHMSRTHPRHGNVTVHKKAVSELDKISKEISDIEKELQKL